MISPRNTSYPKRNIPTAVGDLFTSSKSKPKGVSFAKM